MLAGLVAAVCIALPLLWLPGLGLTFVLIPNRPWTTHLAIAPVITIAALFALGSYLDLIGIWVGWQTVALPLALSALIPLLRAAGRARWRELVDRSRWQPGHLLLLLAMLAAVVLWFIAIGSIDTVPNNDDGANHGIITRRIELLGTLDLAKVYPTEIISGVGEASFYPMGLHLPASMLVATTGISAALALHILVVIFSAVVAPLGVYVLTKRFAAESGVAPALAAGVAAVVIAVIPGFPWGQLDWGPLALVCGMAMLPVLLMSIIEVCSSDSGRWRPAVVFGLISAAIFATHTSEIAAGFFLGVPLAITVLGRNRARWRSASGSLAVAVGLALVLLAPVLWRLPGGLAERAEGARGAPLPWLDSILQIMLTTTTKGALSAGITPQQHVVGYLLVLVALFGAWQFRRVRLLRAMLIGSAVLAVIAWGCMAGFGWAYTLGTTWYSNGYRVAITLTIPIAVLIGLAGAAVTGKPVVRRVFRGGLVAVLAGCLVISAIVGRTTYRDYSVVTAADRAQYAWLADHLNPGERVLNDSADGSMWMYEIAGVAPVFAPKAEEGPTTNFGDRWYLLAHAADLATDPRAQDAARALDVRYIAVGERVVPSQDRRLDPAALSASPVLKEVFRDGNAVVYEVLPF